MIQSRSELKSYINADMAFYHAYSLRDRVILCLTRDPAYCIAKYIRFLRKEEFYYNCAKGPIGVLCCLWYFRRKNKVGNMLGFKIPRNTFGPGLTIYHHGEIIVNESARIGANARLHGGNCIGNDGKTDAAPIIGDNLELGIGAKIIGGVTLGNAIRVGANAVVTKSFEENGLTLIGLPAKNKRESKER